MEGGALVNPRQGHRRRVSLPEPSPVGAAAGEQDSEFPGRRRPPAGFLRDSGSSAANCKAMAGEHLYGRKVFDKITNLIEVGLIPAKLLTSSTCHARPPIPPCPVDQPTIELEREREEEAELGRSSWS